MPTAIPDVKIVQPAVFHDERGFFLEGWNRETMAKAGIDAEFVQDNHSWSRRGVLRGLHYQLRRPQGKLVRVVSGTVFDVVVDLRRRSPTFGKWVGLTLSHESFQTVWIPPGFAHGFLVLSESADFLYKTTDYRVADDERTLLWNDPAIGIDWPLEAEPILTAKDAVGAPLARADVYE